MTTLQRTTSTPVGRPVAGQLIHTTTGPTVPVSLGFGEVIHLNDPAWGRDLIGAVSAAVSVLESEAGVTPTPLPPTEQLVDERDTYRDLLARLIRAERPEELWPAIRDARLALEHWAARP